jgi:FKBP-type peptidyl-prolyl cis-trans isomerase SlyD
MSDVLKVQDGQVIAMDYILHVEGEVIDSSEDQEPLEFIQGAGNIIPGLERELTGMAIGESKKVIVAPADGYGELDTEAFIDVPRDQFPSDIPLEVDTELQVRDQDDRVQMARIDRVGADTVRLDFNHPLAGKELHFDVTIIALRAPTPEELEHGHVHHGHDHEH